jgi:hypothetical protein
VEIANLLKYSQEAWSQAPQNPSLKSVTDPPFYYRVPKHAIKSIKVTSDPLTSDLSSTSIPGRSALEVIMKQMALINAM